MPTLNPSKYGQVRKVSQPNHTAARDASSGFGPTNNPSTGDSVGGESIRYVRTTGS